VWRRNGTRPILTHHRHAKAPSPGAGTDAFANYAASSKWNIEDKALHPVEQIKRDALPKLRD